MPCEARQRSAKARPCEAGHGDAARRHSTASQSSAKARRCDARRRHRVARARRCIATQREGEGEALRRKAKKAILKRSPFFVLAQFCAGLLKAGMCILDS